MLTLTAEEIRKRSIKRIGLLATDGTLESGVYHTVLAQAGIEVVTPCSDQQISVMDVIYNGIKAANRDIDLTGFYVTINELFDQGAEILILGCTELPVAFEIYYIDRPAIDPTEVLAAAAIQFVDKSLVKRTLAG